MEIKSLETIQSREKVCPLIVEKSSLPNSVKMIQLFQQATFAFFLT
eukprot:UN28406